MLQGLLYSLISAFSFASMAILVKLGYNAGLDGNEMMQYRFTYAAVLLALYLFIKDRSLLRISLRDLGKCAFIGLVVYWAQTSCFVNALATIPASTAALVLYVYPVTVTLLSAAFLKMKIDRITVAALTLVMGGCCLVFYDAFLKAVDPTGLMFGVGAMLVFSCYLVLVQVLLKGIKPLTATLYVMSFAAVSFTLSGDITAWLNQSWNSVSIGLGLGIFPGVLAVTFLYLSIEKIGSAYTSIFSSVEPVATLAAAVMFLNENVVLLQMSGAALIILGIVIPNMRMLMLKRRFES
ncbi:DMT family transporter [Pseudodesulfovibrio sp. zrk46]|uniref:DMT family transporter n=1 Tax=Pseudodesulfovibrio sp. zrk46 TaxID=2725288 RepID=UPI0014498236|nr:DMT family transporter [Pseudodesulfovibrio sp. zrk46]QJB58226.1 DMT family transporter [Pseudodesulfovibrio sp. zrk46]